MAIAKDLPSSTGGHFENLEHAVDPSWLPRAPSTTVVPFVRVPILILCTILMLGLLVAGTATTMLSYPPVKFSHVQKPILDGDFKLLGPLLLTAGCFMLIVDIALCAVVTREAYMSSRVIRPMTNSLWPKQKSVSFVGGPFYIATSDPSFVSPHYSVYLGRPSCPVMPNAPFPDTGMHEDGPPTKRMIARPGTTTLARGHQQPPFNPDIEVPMIGT